MAQRSLTRTRRPIQRHAVYGPEVRRIERIVWESLDCICAERLTPQLLMTARHLARFGEIARTPLREEHLGTISAATVTRMLRGLPRALPRLPRKGPAHANWVQRAILHLHPDNGAEFFNDHLVRFWGRSDHRATNPHRLRQQMYDALLHLWERPTITALTAD